jgi:hypothetical protein
MDSSVFERIEERFRSQGPEAVFDAGVDYAREQRDHGLLFGMRAMQARHRLGLALIDTGPVPRLPSDQQAVYEGALREAAREAGNLLLTGGDIVVAWPYFKAIGDYGPVAAAIESVNEGENLDGVIEIAFQEGVNPRKGFELLIQHHGICSAITWFGSIRNSGSRQQCLNLLVEALYREVQKALRETIAATECAPPAAASVAELMAGRPWLFDGMRYYVDSTHVASILGFARELEDPPALRMAVELADYGEALNPMFHYRGEPPFDDPYVDGGIYLRAILGDEVETAITHFRGKAVTKSVIPGDTTPAEVLIDLLVRLNRYEEAIQASLEYLPVSTVSPDGCPSISQLCQMAADYPKLRELSQQRGDLLGYAAGLIAETP